MSDIDLLITSACLRSKKDYSITSDPCLMLTAASEKYFPYGSVFNSTIINKHTRFKVIAVEAKNGLYSYTLVWEGRQSRPWKEKDFDPAVFVSKHIQYNEEESDRPLSGESLA